MGKTSYTCSGVEASKWSFVWKLFDFSTLPDVEFGISFTTGRDDDHQWRLTFNDKRNPRLGDKYFSLYLDYLGEKKVQAKGCIFLVNAEGEPVEANDIESGCGSCWSLGWTIIRKDILLNPETVLLVDDVLTIKCNVVVTGDFVINESREDVETLLLFHTKQQRHRRKSSWPLKEIQNTTERVTNNVSVNDGGDPLLEVSFENVSQAENKNLYISIKSNDYDKIVKCEGRIYGVNKLNETCTLHEFSGIPPFKHVITNLKTLLKDTEIKKSSFTTYTRSVIGLDLTVFEDVKTEVMQKHNRLSQHHIWRIEKFSHLLQKHKNSQIALHFCMGKNEGIGCKLEFDYCSWPEYNTMLYTIKLRNCSQTDLDTNHSLYVLNNESLPAHKSSNKMTLRPKEADESCSYSVDFNNLLNDDSLTIGCDITIIQQVIQLLNLTEVLPCDIEDNESFSNDCEQMISKICDLPENYANEMSSSSLIPSAFDLIRSNEKPMWKDVQIVQDSGILNSLTEVEKKRQEAKFELFLTEATYLKELYIIKDHYLRNIQKYINQKIITLPVHAVFRDIFLVIDCVEEFLKEMEDVWQSDIMLNNIYDVIIYFCSEMKFEAYIKYFQNCSKIISSIDQLEEDTVFSEILRCLSNHPNSFSQPLQSRLAVPGQRISKLPLLINTILNTLQEGTIEYIKCVTTQKALNKLAAECNSVAR